MSRSETKPKDLRVDRVLYFDLIKIINNQDGYQMSLLNEGFK